MNITDASVIGTYFISVLKYMQEPLCMFDKYAMFKIICEELSNSKAPY
jgi:hypothetical protein